MSAPKGFLSIASFLSLICGSVLIIGPTSSTVATEFAWQSPIEIHTLKLHVTPGERCGLFRESDDIHIDVTDNGTVRVFRLDGDTVYDGPSPAKLKLPTGHYLVETKGDRSQFAVLPDDYRGATFFGTEADDTHYPLQTARVENVHPTWARVMGTGCYWSQVEPRPSEWDWKQADKTINFNFGRGRRLIVEAFVRPDWLKDDRQFIPRYLAYVKRLAQRYKNKIYAIEIWNEPWYPTTELARLPQKEKSWRGMVRTYVDILREARRVIKSVAPNIKIFGPAWVSAQDYVEVTEYFASLGGAELLDGFTFHDYSDHGAPPDQDALWKRRGPVTPSVPRRVQLMRQALRRPSLPIYVDEIGLYGQSVLGIPNTGDPNYLSALNWHRGMCRAIKLVVLYRAAGVEALIPHVLAMGTTDATKNLEIYGWETGDWHWGTGDKKWCERGPHPKTSAFLMTCYWLNQATSIGSRIVDNKVFLYGWKRSDGRSLVFAWCAEGVTRKMRDGGELEMMNIFGQEMKPNVLGEEPVLIRIGSIVSPEAALNSVSAVIEE
jgi:hypothetical protein